MIFLNNILGKVSFNFDISKTDDQRTWVNLKNAKDETVISLLYSIYCDLRVAANNTNNNNNLNYNSQSLLDCSYLNSNNKNVKQDISIDVNRNRPNTILKLMNKGNNSVIETYNKSNEKLEMIKEQLNNTSSKLCSNNSGQKMINNLINKVDSNSNII